MAGEVGGKAETAGEGGERDAGAGGSVPGTGV